MTQFFEYSEYDDDFIKKVLAQYGEQMPDWVKGELGKYAVTHKDRDSDLEDYLGAESFVPSMRVSRLLVAQNVANGDALTYEGIDLQSTEVFEWLPGTPSKVTALASGIVSINAFVSLDSSAAGSFRKVIMLVNNSTRVGALATAITNQTAPDISFPATTYLAASDYIELFVEHNVGAPLGATGRMTISYLGKQG